MIALKVGEANIAAKAEAAYEDLDRADERHAVVLTGAQITALVPGILGGELEVENLRAAQDTLLEVMGEQRTFQHHTRGGVA